MTPEEAAEYYRANGIEMPPHVARMVESGPAVPRSRMSLGFGDGYGRAVLTVEFDAVALGTWTRWMRGRQAAMGGVLSDAVPA